MKFVAVAIVLSVFSVVDSYIIYCTYMNPKPAYACKIKYVLQNNFKHLQNATGIHADGKTNQDVKLFYTSSNYIVELPKNLHYVFPNLINIEIETPTFSKISSADLKPFGKNLERLAISDSKIEYLPPDLFDETPNIENFEIQSNEIKFLDVKMFEKLENLSFLRVHVKCYYGQAWGKEELEFMIKELGRNCNQIKTKDEIEGHHFNYWNDMNFKE